MIGGTSVRAFPVPPLPSLAEMAEGTLVKMNESGAPVEFYVAKHDYESELNGAGRTLVVRKDCYDNRVWDNGNVNAYAISDLDSWFNSTYKNMLDADIRSLIGTTKIRYTPGNGNNTVGTLERAVFALSLTELGNLTSMPGWRVLPFPSHPHSRLPIKMECHYTMDPFPLYILQEQRLVFGLRWQGQQPPLYRYPRLPSLLHLSPPPYW